MQREDLLLWDGRHPVNTISTVIKPSVSWRVIYLLPNVPSDLSLLASGIRACSAGEMPEVPKGQGLGRLVRSGIFYMLANP